MAEEALWYIEIIKMTSVACKNQILYKAVVKSGDGEVLAWSQRHHFCRFSTC